MIVGAHQQFINHAVSTLRLDPRVVGILGAGSLITSNMDQYSDVDLVVVSEDQQSSRVCSERNAILCRLGDLLSAFSGEHVGEPRVMICLYGNPLLHVDVKFISLTDLQSRIENPVILFDRDGRCAQTIRETTPQHPMPDPQWIEDRFWTWIHYAALRLGRGELFEVIDVLGFLRSRVFGPLALVHQGQPPRGVRRIEKHCPGAAQSLKGTLAHHDRASCIAAIQASIDLYQAVRRDFRLEVRTNSRAEEEAIRAFHEISGVRD